MGFIICLIAVFIFLILVLFTQNHRLSMQANLEGEGLSADIYWLRSLLRVNVQISEAAAISIYLFELRLYHGPIRKNKKSEWKQRLIKSVDLSHIEVDAAYGLYSPFLTAMAYGVAAFVRNWFPANIERFTHHPQFLSEREFVHVSASGYLSLRHTIKNYFKKGEIKNG